MHARLQIVRVMPPQFNTPEASGMFIKVLEGHPGFRGVHLMLQIGSRQGLGLSLWETQEDATAASDRTRAVLGPQPFPLAFDEVYEVLATGTGPAAFEEATVCQVNWFDGPRSAAQTEAMERAGEERIRPVIEAMPGFVAGYVLCRPEDSAIVVVTLATSTDALEQITDAVFSTALLPGEDPTLLGGPDRVEVYRIENQARAEVPVA